jgi:hypothetical protein
LIWQISNTTNNDYNCSSFEDSSEVIDKHCTPILELESIEMKLNHLVYVVETFKNYTNITTTQIELAQNISNGVPENIAQIILEPFEKQ